MNEEGTPFRSVRERIADMRKVMATPARMTQNRRNADKMESSAPIPVMKNMVMREMSIGNLPLQGTRAFVRMAMRRSRGESMMRQPVTPAALHPKPMHMVNACLPHAPHLRKRLSRLNATRGR